MKNVFITGITGLLGTHLANELVTQGYHVRAIVRNPKRYTGIMGPNIELITSGLWDEYGQHLQGVDIVVHIAAETSTNLIHYEDYERINYSATRRLFELAKLHEVDRFIFISSANTIGHGNQQHPGNEKDPIRSPFSQLHYAQSKLKAENYLLAHRREIKLTILNPTFIIGSHDGKPSSAKLILTGLNRPVVFFPPGGKSFVAVTDVVQAIIQAFDNQTSGERYLLAGENSSYHTFFKHLRHITQQKQLLVRIPRIVLKGLGIIGDMMRKMGIKTSLSSVNMEVLYTSNYYNNHKSVADFGIEYTSLNKALEDTVRKWYK